MAKIKYCIFDVGQVCYPYTLEPLNKYCLSKTADKQNLLQKGGMLHFDYKPFMKGEIDFSAFCRAVCSYCGFKYTPDVEEEIDQAMHQGVGEFYPQTLKIINFLKHQNVEVCLLSNALPNLANTARGLVRKTNVFVSYDLGLLKPDVEIFKLVLQKLGAKPEEVIFVDDKLKNVEAAQSLGICAIVFDKDSIAADIAEIFKKQR